MRVAVEDLDAAATLRDGLPKGENDSDERRGLSPMAWFSGWTIEVSSLPAAENLHMNGLMRCNK